MSEQLKDEFHEAMMEIYHRAKSDADYNATRFLQMLTNVGGHETARRLIPNMSEGFTKLWEKCRLDLTVEAMVWDTPKFHELFSPEELEICRKRLDECGYDFPHSAKSPHHSPIGDGD